MGRRGFLTWHSIADKDPFTDSGAGKAVPVWRACTSGLGLKSALALSCCCVSTGSTLLWEFLGCSCSVSCRRLPVPQQSWPAGDMLAHACSSADFGLREQLVLTHSDHWIWAARLWTENSGFVFSSSWRISARHGQGFLSTLCRLVQRKCCPGRKPARHSHVL